MVEDESEENKISYSTSYHNDRGNFQRYQIGTILNLPNECVENSIKILESLSLD
jgi:hypothetical protein